MGVPLIGLGVSALGQLGSALSQRSAANRQNDILAQRQAQLSKSLTPMLQQGPSAAENALGEAMSLFFPQEGRLTEYRHTPYDAAMAGVPDIDSQSILDRYNTGQDALMQFLNRGSAESTGSLIPNLEGILQTGNPFDVGQTFDALRGSDDYQFNRALAELRGSSGSLGQRFGSAMGQRENDLTAQLSNNINSRNAGIALQAHEAAQGRRLGAAGLLEQLYSGLGNQQLQGLGLGLQGTNSLADFLTGQQGLAAQIGLSNQAATNRASEFNAGMGLDAFRASQGAQSGQLGLLLNALQTMGGLQNSRIGQNLSIMQMLAGQPMQQAMPNPLFGTIGELGQSAALLPFMLQMLSQQQSQTR